MTTNGTQNAADAAALSAAAGGTERMTQITLESGVVLRLKPVSPMMLRSAAKHLERPRPPVVNIPEKGRDEENPNDPDYIRAVAQWSIDVAEAGLSVALMLGTEVESVPEGMAGHEDDAWIEAIEGVDAIVGGTTTIHREGRGRYLDWLRLYAIGSETDFFRLSRVLTSGVALSEEEVNAAAASFRGLASWSPVTGAIAPQPAAVGDNDRDPDPGGSA